MPDIFGGRERKGQERAPQNMHLEPVGQAGSGWDGDAALQPVGVQGWKRRLGEILRALRLRNFHQTCGQWRDSRRQQADTTTTTFISYHTLGLALCPVVGSYSHS